MPTNASLESQLNNLEDLRLPELQACFKQVVGKATRAINRKFLIRKIREGSAAQQGAAEVPTAAGPEKPAARQAKAKATKPAPAKKPGRTKKKASTPATQPEPEPTSVTGPLGPITVSKPAAKAAKAAKATPTKKARKAPIRVVAAPEPEPEPEAATEVEPEAAEPEAAEPTTAPPRPDLKALSVNDLRAAYVEEVGRPTKSTDRNYLMWKIRQARQGKVPVGPASRTHSSDTALRVLPLRMHNDTVEALDDVWRRHSLSSRMDMFRCALHQYLTSLDEHEAAALIHR